MDSSCLIENFVRAVNGEKLEPDGTQMLRITSILKNRSDAHSDSSAESRRVVIKFDDSKFVLSEKELRYYGDLIKNQDKFEKLLCLEAREPRKEERKLEQNLESSQDVFCLPDFGAQKERKEERILGLRKNLQESLDEVHKYT